MTDFHVCLQTLGKYFEEKFVNVGFVAYHSIVSSEKSFISAVLPVTFTNEHCMQADTFVLV